MANRKNQPISPTEPDKLLADKATFKEKLQERIEFGKQLFKRAVKSPLELSDFEKEYYRWNDWNSEYLKMSFNNENSTYRQQYDGVNRSWFIVSGPTSFEGQVGEIRGKIQNKIDDLEKLVGKVDLLKTDITVSQARSPKNDLDLSKVFIVHGHDEAIKQSVARMLEKLHIRPIILHEQPNAGQTIIEKIEGYSDVGFAIVILTPDDEGKAVGDTELKKRARQNVVFEVGYFFGKLARSRVVALYSPAVELPSDLHGLAHVAIDPGGAWKYLVAKELNAAGYQVDLNKLH